MEAVRAADAALASAIERRDLAATMAVYDGDGRTSMITEMLRVEEQRIGAIGSYEQLYADPNSRLYLGAVDVEVSASRDLAVSQGECHVTRTNPASGQAVVRPGFCMKSWRRGEDCAWRIGWEVRAPLLNRY